MATDWQAPTELPDLRRAGMVALDTETKDERAARRARLRLAVRCRLSLWHQHCLSRRGEIRAHYFPLRHPDSHNFDREQVFRWLRDHVDSGVSFLTQSGSL